MPLEIQGTTPPPLDPLEHVVISPANVELERRQATAQRLNRRERRAARAAIKRLDRQLAAAEWSTVLGIYRELTPAVERGKALYAEWKAAPDENLASELRALVPAVRRWRAISPQYKRCLPLARERRRYQIALENHAIAVRREKLHAQEYQRWEKEAQIYERLIVHKLTSLGYAYRRTEGDKHRVDEVQFDTVTITEDAIWYKVDAAYQTAFKNYKTNLPQGIRIVSDLLNPETLDELTVTCQRQVTGSWSSNGAWIVVHRLDAADGLMNFVRFDNVMEYYPHRQHNAFPICVGVGLHRQVQWCNLADYPHWLVGGLTGGGKSNFINASLSTLISMHTPQDLRLVLIDLKGGLEFDFYQGIPHLHGKIIDSVNGVADALHEMEALMYDRFRRARGIAKSLTEYQARRPRDYTPRVVIVFDEVASIMDHGDTTKQILASLRELTRMGRAVGVHVFLCTQRPDVRAIEGAIKVNLAVRLSGRMPSSADSVTILGNNLAANLAAVPGRMVFQLGPDPIQVQTPYISDDNLAQALKVALAQDAPPPLDVPEGAAQRRVHQEWTVERVIEFSIKHLNGKIAGRPIYDQITDGTISRAQVYNLVEQVWALEEVEFEGQKYCIEIKPGNVKYLVPVEGADEQFPSFPVPEGDLTGNLVENWPEATHSEILTVEYDQEEACQTPSI